MNSPSYNLTVLLYPRQVGLELMRVGLPQGQSVNVLLGGPNNRSVQLEGLSTSKQLSLLNSVRPGREKRNRGGAALPPPEVYPHVAISFVQSFTVCRLLGKLAQ